MPALYRSDFTQTVCHYHINICLFEWNRGDTDRKLGTLGTFLLRTGLKNHMDTLDSGHLPVNTDAGANSSHLSTDNWNLLQSL